MKSILPTPEELVLIELTNTFLFNNPNFSYLRIKEENVDIDSSDFRLMDQYEAYTILL